MAAYSSKMAATQISECFNGHGWKRFFFFFLNNFKIGEQQFGFRISLMFLKLKVMWIGFFDLFVRKPQLVIKIIFSAFLLLFILNYLVSNCRNNFIQVLFFFF